MRNLASLYAEYKFLVVQNSVLQAVNIIRHDIHFSELLTTQIWTMDKYFLLNIMYILSNWAIEQLNINDI